MAAHAAMTDCVDQGVGRIVAALKETGQFDNTILFLLSDNGASPERYRDPGYDRPSHTRDGEPIQYEGRFTPGPETTWGYIGPWWANAANTPFRYWKKESFEGGCHTPLIVHWPDGLKAKRGTITDQVGHVIDIMPTCLEVAGADYPERFHGHDVSALEGRSLLPTLKAEAGEAHRTLFFEHVGGRAIRAGDWKLVALKGRPWELYDLSQDRTETNNLVRERHQIARRLEQQWKAWATRVGAAP
jgi:arylsulfatase